MKKIVGISIVLAAMVFSLAGCGLHTDPSATPEPTPVATPGEVENTPAETPAPTERPVPPDIPKDVVPPDFPPVDVSHDEVAFKTATFLTPVLVGSLNATDSRQVLEGDFDILYIMMNLSFDNPDTCYKDIFTVGPYYSQFKLNNIKKLVYQLLGKKDFDPMTLVDIIPNGGYNKDTESLEFDTSFGWTSLSAAYVGNYVHSKFNRDKTQIISTFELMVLDRSTGDLDFISDGSYSLVYDILSENGETFLRVNRIEKYVPQPGNNPMLQN